MGQEKTLKQSPDNVFLHPDLCSASWIQGNSSASQCFCILGLWRSGQWGWWKPGSFCLFFYIFTVFPGVFILTALPKARSGKNVLVCAQASRDLGTALRFSCDKGATFWMRFKRADLLHQSHGQRGPGGLVPTAGKKGIQGLLSDSWS